jgi:hypothetical protein
MIPATPSGQPIWFFFSENSYVVVVAECWLRRKVCWGNFLGVFRVCLYSYFYCWNPIQQHFRTWKMFLSG